MKIASEIVEAVRLLQPDLEYESLNGASWDERAESIIAAKLKPVRDALRDQLSVDNDELCTCDTCERTRTMIAMLSEEE